MLLLCPIEVSIYSNADLMKGYSNMRYRFANLYEAPITNNVLYVTEIDVIALIQCTSPFLKVLFLEEAYNKMQTHEFDCVFSATLQHKLQTMYCMLQR